MGLLNMRERAAALGGDLHVTSAAGEGTRVRVTIPGVQSTGHRVQSTARDGLSEPEP
jgi:signal transduction histidine kinase